MKDVIKQYKGRKFIESEYYQPLVRYIAGLASNNVWLYTVDKVKEFNREKQSSGKTIIRIVRWRAINDKKDKNIKYWRFPRAYNIRSAGEWGVCSQIVDVLIDQKMSSDNFVLLPKGEYDNLLRQIDETAELNIKINRLRTVKSATQVELGLFKKKIRLMKANIKNYEKTLDEFESLVEKGNTTETNVHDYLDFVTL